MEYPGSYFGVKGEEEEEEMGSLPDEMIARECKFLDTPALLRLSQTNKRMYKVCQFEIKRRKGIYRETRGILYLIDKTPFEGATLKKGAVKVNIVQDELNEGEYGVHITIPIDPNIGLNVIPVFSGELLRRDISESEIHYTYSVPSRAEIKKLIEKLLIRGYNW